METYNELPMATGKMLSSLEGKRMAVGARQLKKAVASGRAHQVFVARNADPAITEPILSLCIEHGAQCLWVKSMTELGKACGIEVGATAAAAVDD